MTLPVCLRSRQVGDLIVMTRANRPPCGLVAASASAEILFFTGVRYYRVPDEASPIPPAKKRSRVKAKKAAEALHAARLHC